MSFSGFVINISNTFDPLSLFRSYQITKVKESLHLSAYQKLTLVYVYIQKKPRLTANKNLIKYIFATVMGSNFYKYY